MSRLSILLVCAWLPWIWALPGCAKPAKTTAPPKLEKPPAANPASKSEPAAPPRMHSVKIDSFMGRLLLTDKEAAGPLRFEDHFLEGPAGPLAVDCTDIEEDSELDKVLARAYEKKVRNYILTARQICRPPEDDFVTHCSPRWVEALPNDSGEGVYIFLKRVSYPHFPDLRDAGSRLHLELEFEEGEDSAAVFMVAALNELVNLEWLSMPLTGAVLGPAPGGTDEEPSPRDVEVAKQARAALSSLKYLKHLELTVAPSYTGDFAFLKSMEFLETLELHRDPGEEASLPAAAMEAMVKMYYLESLTLTTPQLDAAILKTLPALHSLAHLSLRAVKVPDGLIDVLAAHAELQRLSLTFEAEVPPGIDFSRLSTSLRLTALRLGALEITLDQLATVFKLVKLSSLSLDFGTWPDKFDLKSLSVFAKLEHLTLDLLVVEELVTVPDVVKTLKSFGFRMMPELCETFYKMKAKYPKLELRVDDPTFCEQ